MELRFPSINTVVLQDRTSLPVQMMRRGVATVKLPVPSGVELTLSRGKLGDVLYKPTTDFLRWGPCVRVMMPSYNDLHDPHLRHYFQRKELNDRLRRLNLVTEDNEVICSLKDYNTYEEYLRGLKMVADHTYDEAQSNKMKKVMKLQEKGRIPGDFTLTEVMDVLLDEDSRELRQLLQAEAANKKIRLRRQEEEEKYKRQDEEDFYTELDLYSWKAEDRARLMMIEKQLRHEQNRLRYQKEIRQERDRKKQAALQRKCLNEQRRMEVEIEAAKDPVLDKYNSRLLKNMFREPPKGEPQYLLPRRSHMERPILRSTLAKVYGQRPARPDLKQAALDQQYALQQKMLSKESERMRLRAEETRPQAEPRDPRPMRSCVKLPALQSHLTKLYGSKENGANPKRARRDQKRTNQQRWLPKIYS
ncbi:fibrous sheath-interacting protein 2-like [Megalops cyprinoides]|uniref:fibrous sheath-interacting protein 2-like n=1 Tax=Megalops cyprinoides TaxID=118141 RepID=UPI001863EECD|nr:fibrous sheath-interacting protein 2-like [Megalops cyprinoides]